ncbi:hypothetical protein HW132_10335 [Brasilonema sp. CT11]|nr:hypothetical protein [Brasilonema sp. CT11]
MLLSCPSFNEIRVYSAEQVLLEYKQQQSSERGFRFLKDPLFFTSSVFVKSPERVAALALLMGWANPRQGWTTLVFLRLPIN